MPWRVGVSPIAALASLARIAIPAYLLFAGLSYLMQDGMIFLPQPRDAQALRAIAVRYPAAQEVRIDTGEGIRLHGWFVSAGDRAAPLLVYFGGNAEEVSWLLGEAGSFPGHSLLLVNYRGYGGSGGQSNESALYADALRVFDHGAARPEVDVTRIAVMGRSLGTAMAAHVAAQRPVRAVVLVSPYDSMVELGRHHQPLLPVDALLKHRFEATKDAVRARAPLLALVAAQDNIVPVERSKTLFEAWAGPRTWREILGADHNGISNHPEYWQAIATFLAREQAP
jgi:pimeloyl-ACP methyl ester carboxylesterase